MHTNKVELQGELLSFEERLLKSENKKLLIFKVKTSHKRGERTVSQTHTVNWWVEKDFKWKPENESPFINIQGILIYQKWTDLQGRKQTRAVIEVTSSVYQTY